MKSCTLSVCMWNLSTKDEIEEQSICGRWGVNEFEEEKKRRGWWLEMLPVCQRLTALASGINSNKEENRARATAHTHARTHSHTHTRTHTGIFSQLFFSVTPQPSSSMWQRPFSCLPLFLPSFPSVKLFSSSLLTQVTSTMRTSATRKEAFQADGEIVDRREGERGSERETRYIWKADKEVKQRGTKSKPSG